MDRMKVAVVESELWNSAIILGMPGANMEDPRGVMTVSIDRNPTFIHFFLSVQFFGFKGSLGPSHVTTLGSSSSTSSASSGFSGLPLASSISVRPAASVVIVAPSRDSVCCFPFSTSKSRVESRGVGVEPAIVSKARPSQT